MEAENEHNVKHGICDRACDKKIKRSLRISDCAQYARAHIIQHQPRDARKINAQIGLARAVHLVKALALVIKHKVEHFRRKDDAENGKGDGKHERHHHRRMYRAAHAVLVTRAEMT